MNIILLILFVINIIVYSLGTFQYCLKMLQLEEYNYVAMIKHYFLRFKSIVVILFLSIICFVLSLFFQYVETFALIIGPIFLVSNISGVLDLKINKPKYTKRIKRIIFLFFVLSICCVIITTIVHLLTYTIILMPYMCILLTTISIFLTNMFEMLLLKAYTKNVTNKLKDSNVIKIAIVGSYGKTSVKNILYTILQEKYSVLMTPESYNTPSGLSLTINNNDLNKYQVFIMEMGAKKKGDIDWLCKKYKPDYAIFTAVGQQHLKTFKNVEEIIKTKSEVLDYVKYCVFNCDNEYVKEISQSFDKEKILVGNGYGLFSKIKELNSESLQFDIYYNGGLLCSANTELTGRHNVNNILLAVGMAIKLNLTAEQINAGVNKLKPIKSRMEKITLENGVTIINNGYNSNPDSAKSSIEFLKLYKEKSKIVITPGFVEMGDSQYCLNYDLGVLIAKNVDRCIIVNKENRQALLDAFIDNDFTKYKVVDKFKQVNFSEFNENDVVLIENDLPDNYV